MANDNDRPKFASKDDLLGLALDVALVELPGGRVARVRGLTADEEARIGSLAKDESRQKKLNALIASLVVVDESGARVFGEEDIDRILKMPGKVVRAIVNAAMKASALDEESRKALGKASAGAGADASSSG